MELKDILQSFLEETDDYSSKILALEHYFASRTDSCETDRAHELASKMAWNIVVESFAKGKLDSRVQALRSALALIKIDSSRKSVQKSTVFYFPIHMLEDVLKQLLCSDRNCLQLISCFREFTNCNDVLFYCWKALPRITSTEPPSDLYVNNYLSLIDALPLKTETKNKKGEEPSIFCDSQDARFRFDLVRVKRWMEECWKHILRWKLRGNNLQKAILVLIDRSIPYLPRPVLLTDFLMDAMDEGGTVSTLALQGVFVLMQKHNLEYPLVYDKLYNMYEPQVFFSGHKSRLFYLTDTFLSSTHLPEALVAGFVKKFARLALVVPSVDAVVLLHMIANLVIRHPSLGKLLNAKEKTVTECSADPYDVDEKDPSKSCAINSSLWELVDLRSHAHPVVSAAAAYALTSHHVTLEKPINEFLDDTEYDLTDKEIQKVYKQVYISTKKPTSIADSFQDKLTQYWELL